MPSGFTVMFGGSIIYRSACLQVTGTPVELTASKPGNGAGSVGGIVTYNVFVTRVDNFNYMMDEASYEAVQLLASTTTQQK